MRKPPLSNTLWDSRLRTLVSVCLVLSCRQQEKPTTQQTRSAGNHRTEHSAAQTEASRLIEERVIFLRGEITDELANEVIGKLLFLENEDAVRPITLEFDSPGGSVTAGLALYDTMQGLKSQVRTHCAGQAASMAAVLLAAGARGARTAAGSCRVMIHQLSASPLRTAASPEEELRQQERLRLSIEDILTRHTGQTRDRVREFMKAGAWLRAEEARAFGVIDTIRSLPADSPH